MLTYLAAKAGQMQQRTRELLDVVDNFLTFHEHWQNDPTLENPPTEYFDAALNIFEVWAAGSLPQECRGELKLAVSKLEIELDALDQSGALLTTDYIDTNQPTFWQAIEKLKAARNPTPPELEFHLESVQLLNEQGVGHEQIAKMWGFYDENNRLRIDWVVKELREPGSVVTPEYEHPELRRRREERERIEQNRQDLGAVAEEYRAKRQQEPCPESSFELWSQGQDPNGTPISVQQAAKMLCVTEAEVEAEWEGFAKEAHAEGKEVVKVGNDLYVPPQTTEGDAKSEEASDLKESETAKEFEELQDEAIELNELKKEARELGVGFSGRIKAETLRAKIEAAKAKKLAPA